MVYGSRRVLQTDSRDMLVLRIKRDIDMGAPKMRAAVARRRPQRERIRSASPRDHRGYAAYPGNEEQLQDTLTDAIDLGTSSVQLSGKVQQKAGRRQPMKRYSTRLPNPRLYPRVQETRRLTQSPFTSRAKKQINQRLCDSPIRHKRRKNKARCLVPNPRLHQAPPNRPHVSPVPPLNPLPSWSPPPKLGPQETASQIALRLSQRTIIPFREFLPPAGQPGPLRKQLNRARAPALREKTRPVKSRPKSERFAAPREKNRSERSPRQKNEALSLRAKSTRREELLPERTLFDSPPPPVRPSILKNGTNPPSLDTVPYQNYTATLPKRYVPRSQYFKPRVVFESSSSSTIQPQRAHTPPTLAEPPMMASTPHSSVTPEDGSDGNDSLSSAPSEYLAEFLSAIMSRKYAEALKYCRLILHYEPQNATARGFYPILRHKLGQDQTAMATYTTNEGKVPGSSNSESGSGSSGAGGQIVTRTTGSPDGAEDMDETSGDSDESDAADYLASLSLDSSAKSSRCESPVANGTDSGSEESAEAAGVAAAELKTAAACWLADDNGNLSPHTHKHKSHRADDDDVENDNAASGDHTLLLKDPTLRQLRAQFACSIK